MSHGVTLRYEKWNESLAIVDETLWDAVISTDELFVRKLVDGTVIHNKLYHHTSNESEYEQLHRIYAAEFEELRLEQYAAAMKTALLERCDRTSSLEAEFRVWDGHKFAECHPISRVYNLNEIAQLLLDHYWTVRQSAYETLYAVLDHDRNKVILFLKEDTY